MAVGCTTGAFVGATVGKLVVGDSEGDKLGERVVATVGPQNEKKKKFFQSFKIKNFEIS